MDCGHGLRSIDLELWNKDQKKFKSAKEPSGPSGGNLSQFLWHKVARSISTPPQDGMPVYCRVTPSIELAGTHSYTWVEGRTVRV